MRKRKIQKIRDEKSKEAFLKQRGEGRKEEGIKETKEEEQYQNIFRTFAEAKTATKLHSL